MSQVVLEIGFTVQHMQGGGMVKKKKKKKKTEGSPPSVTIHILKFSLKGVRPKHDAP